MLLKKNNMVSLYAAYTMERKTKLYITSKNAVAVSIAVTFVLFICFTCLINAVSCYSSIPQCSYSYEVSNFHSISSSPD